MSSVQSIGINANSKLNFQEAQCVNNGDAPKMAAIVEPAPVPAPSPEPERLCSRCALEKQLNQQLNFEDYLVGTRRLLNNRVIVRATNAQNATDVVVENPPTNLAVLAWRDIKQGRRRQVRRGRQAVVHYPDNRCTRSINRALGQRADTTMQKLIKKLRGLGVCMRAVKLRPTRK